MLTMEPVGRVRSTRGEARDDGWDAEEASIELDPRFAPDALAGLADFSHVAVIFHMDRADPGKVATGARRPRGNPAWPAVGIFAQRGKDRPNHLGLTVCRIRGVEGRIVRVEGLDAIDGTPVLDLKPWMASFGPRGDVREPAWAGELMAGYWELPPPLVPLPRSP